jgi:CheY-like chemotaxis protein
MVRGDSNRKRALVVDDDPLFCFSAAVSLKMAGYEVREASNGRWALETMDAERKEGREFNLFLIDLVMPVMDGMELIREIQKINLVERVLAVSGSIDAEVLRELESFGCRHWLAKPFLVGELMEAVGQTQKQGV